MTQLNNIFIIITITVTIIIIIVTISSTTKIIKIKPPLRFLHQAWGYSPSDNRGGGGGTRKGSGGHP